MKLRSLLPLAIASVLGLALTGCPSTRVVEIRQPIDHPVQPEKPVTQPVDGKGEEARLKEVTKQLAAARAKHLDQLHAYWDRGEFPMNETEDEIANIFRDRAGHLCAVANMLWTDGETELVDDTAERDNLIRLADVHDGPLYDWVMQSGFTQEEVAMIQVPYMPYHPDARAQEILRLQTHLAEVESRLRDDTAQGLRIAAKRFLANSTSTLASNR